MKELDPVPSCPDYIKRKVTLYLFERTRWIYGTHTEQEITMIKSGGTQMRNASKNFQSRKISDMSEEKTQITGVAGEHGLCKAVRVPFELRINTFKEMADVGSNIEVRTSRKHAADHWPEFSIGRAKDIVPGRIWACMWISPCFRAFIFAGTIYGDRIPECCKRGKQNKDGEETWLVLHSVLDSPMYLFYDLHPELKPEPEIDWALKYSHPELWVPPKMLQIPPWP